MSAIRITGDQELQATIASLKSEGKAGASALRKGLRAGAKVVADQLKIDTPKLTGRAAQSVKVRALKRKRGRVGVTVTLTAQTAAGFPYPIAVESGAKQHPPNATSKEKKQRHGNAAIGWHVRPRGFGKKAVSEVGDEALQVTNETILAELEKQVKR